MSIIDAISQATASFCGVELYPIDPSATTLDWMEQSTLGVCVAQSPAGYYIALGFHAVGLSMLVGVAWVTAFNLLGWIRGATFAGLHRLTKLAWWGLAINAISGICLFFSEANKAFYSNSFRIKISLVLLGCISTFFIDKTILKPATLNGNATTPSSTKTQAYLSLLVWLLVIFMGRFMSYLTEFDGSST